MLLGKLIGYDLVTGQYLNAQQEEADLPKNAFYVGIVLPSDYEDITNLPENWTKYSIPFIDGTITGFKDILCMRSIIKPLITAIAGNDYSTWDNLSSEQKTIALTYFPTKIIDAQGYIFFITKCGGGDEAGRYIANWNKIGKIARELRYTNTANLVYLHLGKADGLKAETSCPIELVQVSFYNRGIIFKAEDGVDGFGDWLLSTNGFSVTGLKAQIDLGVLTIKTGLPTQTLIDSCINIIENGAY